MKLADLVLVSKTRAALKSGAARKLREQSALSAAEVARALGVSRQSISYWEAGELLPTAEHALAYGKLLRDLGKRAA